MCEESTKHVGVAIGCPINIPIGPMSDWRNWWHHCSL